MIYEDFCILTLNLLSSLSWYIFKEKYDTHTHHVDVI